MKIVFIILVLLILPYTGFASSIEKSIKEGNVLYGDQKFDGALGKYNEALEKDPNSDITHFDIGAALYKKNDYHESIRHFQKSLLTNDEKLKEKVYYNLGNAFYKSGIEKEEKDLNATVNLLKESLEEYEKTLVLNKKNEDAIFNYEFVTKELERIEKKRQQKKQKDSQDQDSDKSDQQKNQSGQGLRQGGPDKSDEQKDQSDPDQQKEKQTKQQESDQKKETNQSEASKNGEPEKEQDMKVDSTREMSKEEAESLLKGYKYNEEPQGLLNFHLGKGFKYRVLKDW